MKLRNITVQIGGFHDHWLRNESDNPTLLMAAVQYYNYDFICLLDEEFGAEAIKEKEQLENWLPGFKVYLGVEHMFDWGHMICIKNKCEQPDFATKDWRSEMKRLHAGGGLVALAHIGYPNEAKQVFKTDELNEVIDGDYVDAIQLEKTKDWKWVEKRANDGKRLPLVGGWDAHLLKKDCDDESNLYTKDKIPSDQIDAAPGMRTIVFAEDNSFESIKKAVREGKSVLEFVKTGELFGSPELVDLLISEGYAEIMKEKTEKQNELILKNEPLKACHKGSIQFPAKGTVYYPVDSNLKKAQAETDEIGFFEIDKVPMPVMQKFSYIPVVWHGEQGKRLWAVKVLNNIRLDVIPDIRDGKRVVVIKTENDISGEVSISKPYEICEKINAKGGEEIPALEIGNELSDVFDFSMEVHEDNGGVYKYNNKLAVAVALKNSEPWEKCHKYYADSQEHCGGFGSHRPYPGKDVFSGCAQFKWDEDNLYARFDIVDPIHINPEYGHYMYRSDCIFLTIDPALNRDNDDTYSRGFMIGFPKEGPLVWSKNKIEDAVLEMEETENGRIVTVSIPWNTLKNPWNTSESFKPASKMNIGISFGMTNDEGSGVLDHLEWPVAPENGRMGKIGDCAVLRLD